jgi:hypothetical protein
MGNAESGLDNGHFDSNSSMSVYFILSECLQSSRSLSIELSVGLVETLPLQAAHSDNISNMSSLMVKLCVVVTERQR